ncbi:uncharacterized protein LOC132601393 [Lycium barbarum]|uniref:uncharacterized protein LOC132601393 n=1 Tax=Lycium barbarum TaxID=112863 RepID=UPI00293E01FB|nr:uncharacterized protein LOC132601393 [Lycium barbarum]
MTILICKLSLRQSFYPCKATKRVSQSVKSLYRGAISSRGKVPVDLKKQMFLEFRTKCFWNPEHETLVAQNFEKKAGNILKHALRRARQKVLQPKWTRDDNRKKLLHFWATDPTFLKQSENGKKARASDKGGFPHTSGATSHEDVRMKLTLERGQEVPQDEVFKITHTRKAKNADGTDQWIEPRAQQTYTEFQRHKLEYCASQPTGTSMTNEIIAQQWMEKIAPPTRYGIVYGMPNRACRQFLSFLQGVGTTSEGAVDPKEYQEMKLKVNQLTSTLSSTEARMLHMQAQIDSLLNSGPSHIPPYPGDARRSQPSRRRRSQDNVVHALVDEDSGEESDHVSNT